MTEDKSKRRDVRHSTSAKNEARRVPYVETKQRGAEDSIPILRYGPNNNYVEFKKRLSLVCLEKYKVLGRVIEEEKYWVPEEVDLSLYPSRVMRAE